jgi:hypothetical protein
MRKAWWVGKRRTQKRGSENPKRDTTAMQVD